MHDITYAGLCGWSRQLFENFGWMILASKNGDTKGIISYKEEIETLIEYVIEKLQYLYKLQEKDRNVVIEDKINDMKILKMNLEYLHKFSSHLMKTNNPNMNVERENIFINLDLKKKNKNPKRKLINSKSKDLKKK